MASEIFNEDGSSMGLFATPRADGALEIHTLDGGPPSPSSDPGRGGQPPPGSPPSRSEQGLGDPVAGANNGEPQKGSGAELSTDSSAGSPPLSWAEIGPSREEMGLPPLERYILPGETWGPGWPE